MQTNKERRIRLPTTHKENDYGERRRKFDQVGTWFQQKPRGGGGIKSK